MNEVSETCSICSKPNDQMLMLSCVHDPCINCAATTFAQQVHIKGQSKELYICQICGQQTLLDNSTVLQLSALASSVIKMPSRPHKQPAPPSRPSRKEVQHGTSSIPAVPAVSAKKVVYYCKEHSQEEISYYCFTCWANICPQCAIHGSHKDHEVKLIKKAIAQVKGQYLDLSTRLADSQGSMTKAKEGFLRLIKDTNDRHQRQKHSLTRQFDLLRAALSSKQKQLIRQLDQVNKQNLAALTRCLQTINSNYEEANKSRRTIEVITKKDEVLILEDYKKIGELEQLLSELGKSTEGISGQCSALNTQFLQQECKHISESIGRLKANLKTEQVGTATVSSSPSRNNT